VIAERDDVGAGEGRRRRRQIVGLDLGAGAGLERRLEDVRRDRLRSRALLDVAWRTYAAIVCDPVRSSTVT
jgi:hypothetical protein